MIMGGMFSKPKSANIPAAVPQAQRAVDDTASVTSLIKKARPNPVNVAAMAGTAAQSYGGGKTLLGSGIK
jgi:hypothetical protein